MREIKIQVNTQPTDYSATFAYHIVDTQNAYSEDWGLSFADTGGTGLVEIGVDLAETIDNLYAVLTAKYAIYGFISVVQNIDGCSIFISSLAVTTSTYVLTGDLTITHSYIPTSAITPTEITTEDQIYLTGSPINLRIQNLAQDNTIASVVCELYIWSGALNTPPVLATKTLIGNQVSIEDNYINIQIAEILASYINKTKFAYNGGDDAPSIAGEGVFWQIRYQVTNNDASFEAALDSVTNFATRGYRFDYEQVGYVSGGSNVQPYLGLLPISLQRNYTEKIKYYVRDFDYTQTLGTATSENIISSTVNTPTTCKTQLGDKYLVIYLNRLGLFDMFTPYGKVIKSVKVEADTNPRLYRDPNRINNSVHHSKQRTINNSEQTFVINSGDLHESMTDQIEEVIYSPLVYLLEFTGETYTVVQTGLTVDSTIVTVDDTTYTADNDTITTADLGYYSTFKQIPVTCENKDFLKKTRLNNKGKIDYDLTFETTTGRLNNLR